MAASPMVEDPAPPSSQEKWTAAPDANGREIAPPTTATESDRDTKAPPATTNGGGEPHTSPAHENHGDRRSDGAPFTSPGGDNKSAGNYRERQAKPNKVYIGGLPENTQQEDLQSCFGKIGNILNIELKVGYGFVEFDSKEAADESVAKYHEGFFMGNKIRVELSHGRVQKPVGDTSACFKCGKVGHWARECTNPAQVGGPGRASHYNGHHAEDDRSYSGRDYPPRDHSYHQRENDYGRYSAPRGDSRYGYDYPPQPPPQVASPPSRDYRRPASPPRDYRDYPERRDYDEYRARPPVPAPPARGYYAPEVPTAFPPRAYDAPSPVPPRDYVDRGIDRRAPPAERYSQYSGRPRTPPGPPPRARESFDRPPPRDYPPVEYRGRAVTPPLPPASHGRYGDYPPRNGAIPDQRYRRRSMSPPPRASAAGHRSGGYAPDQGPEPGYHSYGAPAGSYSGNGSVNGYNSRSVGRDREYVRGGPDIGGGYPRR